MTHAASTLEARHDTPVAATDPDLIASRFGPIALDPERVITFQNGLLGFAGHGRFQLSEVPGCETAFKLLQAIDDAGLGFFVLPLDPDNGPIAAADLDAACRTLGFERGALAVLAVVTVRAEADGVRCTANLRAPLLIEATRRLGCQYVLGNDAYAIRHALEPGNGHGR